MSNNPTVRYEYRESRAPLFLKATWVRIETSDFGRMIFERITPCEKPQAQPQISEQLGFSF
jgi:hypothetical protein